MIQTVVQTTEPVDPSKAFDFWRSTALAHLDAHASVTAVPFAARRLVAVSEQGTLIHTHSAPVAVERHSRHARRDGSDEVGISMCMRGLGYQEQGRRGGLLRPGDLGLVALDRPFAIGAYEPYEEIRLHLPRAAFQAWVGPVDALAGATLRHESPIRQMLAAHLRSFAGSAIDMTEAEAATALEVTGLLLRHLVGEPGRGGDLSTDAIRSLARARIERNLHDPSLDPASLCRDLGISRSRLYAAFSDGQGIAAAIRDARLDRVHRCLSAPLYDVQSIAAIMFACGLRDAPSFSRAFRRRFGVPPRAVRALRGR